MMTPKTKKRATWAAIAMSCVATFEGLRTYAYRDPVGIPTICFGETKGVEMGDRATPEQCREMLGNRLEEFNAGISKCVMVPISDSRRAALVSFSYNVGIGAACRSSLVRRINTGDPDACDELLRWTRAGGIELPGLKRRREEERRLCLG